MVSDARLFDREQSIDLGLQVPSFCFVYSDGPLVISGSSAHGGDGAFDPLGRLDDTSPCTRYGVGDAGNLTIQSFLE